MSEAFETWMPPYSGHTAVVPLVCVHIRGAPLASFPGPAQFSVAFSRKSRRGPGIFSHVSDVGIERMVERFNCVWGHRAQNSKTANIAGNLPHLSS